MIAKGYVWYFWGSRLRESQEGLSLSSLSCIKASYAGARILYLSVAPQRVDNAQVPQRATGGA